ncbi:ankyrin repeat protein, putative [Bodo saltans]|uniref:Ankyrin repeat protein, putative n=1 Tax=Bodo saltans TaxID=75058 RepID=A0A0S4KK40_BODSA|nr:ankyrin repeat protein, putative [Bodo saltans]|eukprot:CUI14934.1 ankyrin repeat protein, putative [Bodo saltans]
MQGDVDIIKALVVARGASVKDGNVDGDTPFHFAVYHDQLEAAKELLKLGADDNKRNCKGASPLTYAASQGKADAIPLPSLNV